MAPPASEELELLRAFTQANGIQERRRAGVLHSGTAAAGAV